MFEDIKDRIIRVARQAQHEGLCRHKSGNFSVRDKDSGQVIVTPSGIDRDFLRTDRMVVMDMEANVIECAEGIKPSSEVLVHIAIYKARPDITAVAHTHSKYATVFAVLNRPVPPFVYEAMFLGCKDHTIPVAPYGRPGTQALADHVAETMKDSNAALMQSHGAIACHADGIEAAYLNACYVEELSEMYHHILSCNGGKEPELLSTEELQAWAYPKEIRV